MANPTLPDTIWCLFGVENNYDQPDHNLVMWWREKPSIEKFANAIGVQLGEDNEETVNLVAIWTGKPCQIRLGQTYYSLEEVQEGKELSE